MSATTAGRGGGRERQHALGAELARPRGQLEVVGPEVVPPLGDAVRLVDREQRDRRLGELGEEALVVEPLGRDVEELQAAGAETVGDVARLGCSRLESSRAASTPWRTSASI